MKLIFCKSCEDIVKLIDRRRSCRCGQSAGKYITKTEAIYSGKYAIPLGISEATLTEFKEGTENYITMNKMTNKFKKVGVTEY